MGYEVLRYRPDLKPAALTLLTHAWGDDLERNARTFAWKFERNPYLEQPLLQIVTADGRPVAIRSLQGVRCLRGPDGTALRALGTGDFAIDPAHRGRHLFGRIMAAAAAQARELGYRYLVSLSAGPATRLQSLRAGWRDLGEIVTLQRASQAARIRRLLHARMDEHRGLRALAASARRQAWLRAAAGVRSVPDRFKPLEGMLGRTWSAQGLSLSMSERPRPEAMASLIARRSRHDAVRSAHDAQYLAWRFDNPLSSYRFVYCDASTLEGFIVLETPDDPERDRVRIVLWAAQNEALRLRLLRTVIEAGRFADLRLWNHDVTSSEAEALHGIRFRRRATDPPSRHHLSLLLMDLAPSELGPGLPGIDGWQLRMIDSDKC